MYLLFWIGKKLRLIYNNINIKKKQPLEKHPNSGAILQLNVLSKIKGIREANRIISSEKLEYYKNADSTIIFSDRIAENFPGIRGLVHYKYSSQVGKRLAHVLHMPKEVKASKDIIWWFRGPRNNSISTFRHLYNNKYLLNFEELHLKDVWVYNDGVYWRNFIYVETEAAKPTGLYRYGERQIDEYADEYGFYSEEYGIYGLHKMTRNEYDDSATIIFGKTVNTHGKSKLRVRYITPYNFIICAHNNPINNSKLDKRFQDILNGILRGQNSVNDIVAIVETLTKRESRYS